MKQRNLVAKHMNTYNRASVVPDKRDKHLDDLMEQETFILSDEAFDRFTECVEAGGDNVALNNLMQKKSRWID